MRSRGRARRKQGSRRSAAIGRETARQWTERARDHLREFSTSSTLIGVRVLHRPLALHDRDHRQLLVREPIRSSCSARARSRTKSAAPSGIGLLELPGETDRCDDIAGAPDTEAAALGMRDQCRIAQARGESPRGMTEMDDKGSRCGRLWRAVPGTRPRCRRPISARDRDSAPLPNVTDLLNFVDNLSQFTVIPRPRVERRKTLARSRRVANFVAMRATASILGFTDRSFVNVADTEKSGIIADH